jgi:hypothetical protein
MSHIANPALAAEFAEVARLAEIDALERRYNGPIPAHLRPERTAQEIAYNAGMVAFWQEMVDEQIRTISARKADGSYYPELAADLAYYRRELRKAQRCKRIAHALIRMKQSEAG